MCSALEGRKLCELAAVAVKRRQGPPQGANVFVTYDLRKSHVTPAKSQPKYRSKPAKQTKTLELNSATALVLVSCVKSKLHTTVPAQDPYTSTLFSGMRSFANRSGTVIAMALTSQPQKARFPLTYSLQPKQLQKTSWVKISQIRTLSVDRIGRKLGTVEPEQLAEIVDGLNQIIGI